jgi:hypothetical protein
VSGPGLPDDVPGFTFVEVLDTSVPAGALGTPEAWQEWLGEQAEPPSMAWAGDRQVPETNYMRRARPGQVTNGYVKSAATRDGLAVWEKVG